MSGASTNGALAYLKLYGNRAALEVDRMKGHEPVMILSNSDRQLLLKAINDALALCDEVQERRPVHADWGATGNTVRLLKTAEERLNRTT